MNLGRWVTGLLVGLLCVPAGRTADIDRSPVLLVAKPEMREFYRGSVLFARPVGDGQHIGFIVNRPTALALGQIFPQHAPAQKLTEPVFLGGPFRVNVVFAVVNRDASPGPGTIALAKDLFLVMDAGSVDRLIEENRPDTRFYAGLVAWQPGELERELRHGFWYVVDADPRLVLRRKTDGLWQELIERSRGQDRLQRVFLPPESHASKESR